MSSFAAYPLAHGQLADLRGDGSPTLLCGWVEDGLTMEEDGTLFGFVHQSPAILRCHSGEFTLAAGMYFAVPGCLSIGPGCGVVIAQTGYRGLFHLGGPIEDRGRLRYINGCTDSLLIPPAVRGDPCLNLLHLPAGARQQRESAQQRAGEPPSAVPGRAPT